jgi:nucleoid-associated protein YgaU
MARHANGPGFSTGTGRSRPSVGQIGTAPASTRTPAGHMVNFYALDGSADITVQMGDGAAELSGGDGGWQTEARWGAEPVTWWLAPAPYEQTIPLMFETWRDRPSNMGDFSQETAIGVLRRLARSPGGRRPPPVVMIAGPAIQRADLPWVVQTVADAGQVIRREGDGNRIRQAMTVSLLQYGAPVKLGSDTSPTRRRATKTKWRVRAGDTLPQIAASVYGDANRWKEIAHANNIRDPRALTVGRELRIP